MIRREEKYNDAAGEGSVLQVNTTFSDSVTLHAGDNYGNHIPIELSPEDVERLAYQLGAWVGRWKVDQGE